MEEVLIVEAVRSPLGRRERRPRGPASRRSARRRAEGRASSARASIRRRDRPDRSAAACRRWASSRSTSRAPRGSPRACRSRSRRPPSTASAARASRRRRSPPGSSAPGIEDLVLACGVEIDEPHPARRELAQGGAPAAEELLRALRLRQSQFQGAELIAKEYGITREDTDALRPAQPAARERARGTRAASTREVRADRRRRSLDAEGKPTGETRTRRARRGPARDVAREARAR